MEHANKLSLQGWSQHGIFQNASCDYSNSCLSDKYFLLLKKIFKFGKLWINFLYLGVVHKLRCQDFGFFCPPALTFSMVWTLTKIGHLLNTYLPRLVNVLSLWTTPRYDNFCKDGGYEMSRLTFVWLVKSGCPCIIKITQVHMITSLKYFEPLKREASLTILK